MIQYELNLNERINEFIQISTLNTIFWPYKANSIDPEKKSFTHDFLLRKCHLQKTSTYKVSAQRIHYPSSHQSFMWSIYKAHFVLIHIFIPICYRNRMSLYSCSLMVLAVRIQTVALVARTTWLKETITHRKTTNFIVIYFL